MMVMARLHLICGNCGCNDEWKWEYDAESCDMGDGTFEPDVSINCNNCATRHSLSENAKHLTKP